ncbi:MAG TPA: hypothetical protein VJ731_02190 [Terriglobales bacterium]|nr:hypothetical protein [Terriglobales bacterium]
MPRDERIRQRDQQRLRQWGASLGVSVQSRETRVALQYLQALDSGDLLTQCVERQDEFASAALFRFGLDTLATGFWITCVTPEEWLQGNSQVHIPTSLPQIIATLPATAEKMLAEVVNSGFVNDSKRTLLADVLNPATHGDALVSFMRIGSAAAQGNNWAHYLALLMHELTHNFVVLIKELAAIDLASIAAKSMPTNR